MTTTTPTTPTTLASLATLADALERAQAEVSDLLDQRRTVARQARAQGHPVAEVAVAMRMTRQMAHRITHGTT